MKKAIRLIAAALVLPIVCGVLSISASSKDLEPCYHCQNTGQFHCHICNNQVYLTCDGCNGRGGSVCPGEEGKGPCNNGYYTCPSCHGDTYARAGDGTIPQDAQPGTCGQCGGKGKLECWNCHGKGYNTCDRCGGSGKVECQNENCKVSRTIGWKCRYCMGAGYMLTNFWQENDGVQNKPVKGDLIWVNGKSMIYGDSSGNASGSNSGPDASQSGTFDSNGANIPHDPNTGRDFIWYVDLGSGTWEIDGKTVTVKRGGAAATGVVDLKFYENIELAGIPENARVRVFLLGDNGFRAELEMSGNREVAVGRNLSGNTVIPFRVRLSVEQVFDTEPNDPGERVEPDMSILPDNRHSDYTIPIPEDPERPVSASARLEMGKMSDDQQRYYAELPEEELASILTNVRAIVTSAEPGKAEAGLEKALDAIAEQNGFTSLEEARIFPIRFEGHASVGFPVKVTVRLQEGALPGGADLYVYHLADDGRVEDLGLAEYSTYADGSVETLSFYTAGFSSFFTSKTKLDVAAVEKTIAEALSTPAPDAQEFTADNAFPTVRWIVGGVLVAAAVAVGVVVYIKKRSSEPEVD